MSSCPASSALSTGAHRRLTRTRLLCLVPTQAKGIPGIEVLWPQDRLLVFDAEQTKQYFESPVQVYGQTLTHTYSELGGMGVGVNTSAKVVTLPRVHGLLRSLRDYAFHVLAREMKVEKPCALQNAPKESFEDAMEFLKELEALVPDADKYIDK